MDRLCGSMIIADRLRNGQTLHAITLPKSWLARLIPDAEALRSQEIQLALLYKSHMAELLEQVYTGVNAGE